MLCTGTFSTQGPAAMEVYRALKAADITDDLVNKVGPAAAGFRAERQDPHDGAVSKRPEFAEHYRKGLRPTSAQALMPHAAPRAPHVTFIW